MLLPLHHLLRPSRCRPGPLRCVTTTGGGVPCISGDIGPRSVIRNWSWVRDTGFGPRSLAVDLTRNTGGASVSRAPKRPTARGPRHQVHCVDYNIIIVDWAVGWSVGRWGVRGSFRVCSYEELQEGKSGHELWDNSRIHAHGGRRSSSTTRREFFWEK